MVEVSVRTPPPHSGSCIFAFGIGVVVGTAGGEVVAGKPVVMVDS